MAIRSVGHTADNRARVHEIRIDSRSDEVLDYQMFERIADRLAGLACIEKYERYTAEQLSEEVVEIIEGGSAGREFV
jgi:hypothetical protein